MFHIAVDISFCSIIITDSSGSIIYVNDSCCEVTGYQRHELIGQNPRILKSGLQNAQFYEDMWNTIISGKVWQGEFANKRKDGSIYWERARICRYVNNVGVFFIGVKEDITTTKNLQDKLNKLAQESEKLQAAVNHGKPELLTC